MTLRPIGVSALLLLLLESAGAQEQSSYIGLIYQPMPDGCKDPALNGPANEEGNIEVRQMDRMGINCGEDLNGNQFRLGEITYS